MLRPLWKLLGRRALGGALLLTVANLVQAQTLPGSSPTPSPDPSLGQPTATVPASTATAPTSADELKSRIERLEKQNQELMESLKTLSARSAPTSTATEAEQGGNPNALSPQDVRQIVGGYLAEKEEQKKFEEKAKKADGYKVGTDLRMNVSWQNGVVFETPNKDFWMRSGFRFQYDVDYFHQPKGGKNAAPAGVGTLLDTDYFRRIRPNFSGGFWEVGEFNVEVKLENISNGAIGMDDVWVGVKDIPFIGTVRIGHFHLPHGLEADMYSSSKPSTFFEVYSGNNAFYSSERTGSGLWLTNAFLDQRMTYAASLYRPENAANGDDFSEGNYGAIGRLTFLPIYENGGRCLLHVGGSATYRHALNGTVDFRTQPQLFDFVGGDNGYGNPAGVTVVGTDAAGKATNSPTVSGTKLTATQAGFAAAPGNNARWVDTGALLGSSSSIYSSELLYIRGPFSLQAEFDWAFANSVTGSRANGVTGAGASAFSTRNIGFTGGYIQASYFLTGENRTYDKRLGRLGSEYIAKANTPFWFVRDENGYFNHGLGAWELAARYSRLDLNSGPIQGGILDNTELGVNWHLNNNLRLQFMYIHADRFGLPKTASGTIMDGFGLRTQFTF